MYMCLTSLRVLKLVLFGLWLLLLLFYQLGQQGFGGLVCTGQLPQVKVLLCDGGTWRVGRGGRIGEEGELGEMGQVWL